MLGYPTTRRWHVSQRFGDHPDWYAPYNLAGHEGVDFACPAGTPVFASHDGWCEPRWRTAYGEHVYLYGDECLTLYAHLSKISVAMGQRVKRGEQIGESGNTGRTTGPHLHLGLKVNGVLNGPYKDWIDPVPYFEKEDVMTKTTMHVQRVESWMEQAIRDLGADWVKLVNPPAGPDPMPRVANKLVRLWTDDIDAGYIRRGEEGGRDFVRRMLPEWRGRPWATCYSLANEPECNNPDSNPDALAHLCGYSIGAMKEASANGIRVVILDLPEGNPSGDEGAVRWKLEQLAPAVQMAGVLGHYVGLHAYWRPDVEGPLGRWHALGRIEWDMAQWIGKGVTSMGVTSSPRVLLTEWGVDGGIAGRTPKEGWRKLYPDPQTYFHEVAEGEKRLRDLPWIIAAFLFDFGYEEPWYHYDHDEGATRSIIGAMQALPDEASSIAPVEESSVSDIAWAKSALGSWPATMKDARINHEEWIMQDPDNPWRYISRVDTTDTYYVVVLDPNTWKRVRATLVGQTTDLL